MATIRLIDRSPGVVETGGEAALGQVDPVESELMVLTGRTVLGKAVDREGFRIFDASNVVPAGFIEEAEVTLPFDGTGTIHLEFKDEGITYGLDSDHRTVEYGKPITVEGARFVVPAAPEGVRSVVLEVVHRDQAIDYLQSNLETLVVRNTGGVNVTVTSLDPGIPTRAVNAIVEVYQEVNADLARRNVHLRRVFLEEQLRTTDSLHMVAQAGLSGFRAREQAYSAAGRFSAEQSNLISVEIQQAQLQADLRMVENAFNQFQDARATGQETNLSVLMSVPGIGSDPVVSGLYSQLAGYRTERESLVAGTWARAVTHPDVRRLDILIASTEERLLDAMRNHISSARAQIASLGSLRGRAVAKMSDLPRTEVEEVYLSQNLAALQQMGDQLRDQYQAVRLEEAAEAGLVEIVQLSTSSYPVANSPWTRLLLGLVAGLMLGGGIALIREKLDHSINRPQEIEEYLLVPNLAVIPQAKPYLLEAGSNGDGSNGPLDPPGVEAYRILRANLLFSQGRLKTLVISSAAPGEGKTMTAVNLSAAIARQGLRVLLMECDFRRPSLAQFFKAQDGIDLSDVVLEKREWREAIHHSEIPGLDLLLAARAIPQAAEYLAGSDMKSLLTELSAHYDMVILDTSPLLVAADAMVLGAIVDGVLLVVRTTGTDREAVQQAVHQLSLVGARIVGTVLNDPDGSVVRYGNYYDYSAAYEGQ
jgi:capsular exopolysaccharide synthesis family protein